MTVRISIKSETREIYWKEVKKFWDQGKLVVFFQKKSKITDMCSSDCEVHYLTTQVLILIGCGQQSIIDQ